MQDAPKTLAIFDLDGTITRKDTLLEFIRYTHGSVRLYLGFVRHGLHTALYLLKLYPNYRFKELIFRHFYGGKTEAEVQEWGDAFAGEILPGLCYHKAIARLRFHTDQQHEVIILTASSPIWLQGWTDKNGFRLIGTSFETKNGRYTGRISGSNCSGKQKIIALESCLDPADYAYIYAYGDSESDRPFMELAHEAYYRPFSS